MVIEVPCQQYVLELSLCCLGEIMGTGDLHHRAELE